MRKRLFEIIDSSIDEDKLKNLYDVFMMIVILLSLIPLAFKNENIAFQIIDKIAVVIFIIDYIFRLITADYKLNKKVWSFFIYPFKMPGFNDRFVFGNKPVPEIKKIVFYFKNIF